MSLSHDRLLSASAFGAAALAGLYALVSAYWTLGGTALLSTVGGGLEELATAGGTAAAAVGASTVLLKLAGAVVALALVLPWGDRVPPRLLEGTAVAAGAVLAVYGGGLVVIGALALTGLFGTPADPNALRWHVLVWDLWFLLWGALLLVAGLRRGRLRWSAA